MRLYRLLLLLYPAAFRVEYDDELCQVVAARIRSTHGVLSRLVLWFDIAADVLLTAWRTHADIVLQDLRYSLRAMRISPGFAVTAILVAALGVGATTAAYTLTDHVLLRPLPFPQADRLMNVWEDMSPGNYTNMEPSPANYRDWKRLNHSFSAMAAYRSTSVGMTGAGDPQQVEGAAITSDLLPMLGAQPLFGRMFSAADDRTGAPGTALLSSSFWQARFGGDTHVLGRRILLDGDPFVVIGVMPKQFNFPRPAVQMWIAMRFSNDDFLDRNNNYLNVLAKLRPGVSRERAVADMRLVSAELKRLYPKENEHVGVTVEPLTDKLPRRSRLMLLALMGAALCVLLIACTNLANLLLARGLMRRREIAVRQVLGAGRERLVRQILTESLLLSLGGGLLGVAGAAALVPLLAALVPDSLPIATVPTVDARVLLVSLAATLLTGVFFGVAPAARATAGSLLPALAENNRAGGGGTRREQLRRGLVIAEISISFTLLMGCGLLVRALWHLQKINPGFRADNVLTLRTALPMPRYASTAKRLQFYDRVLAAIRQLPGVQNAGYISFLPMTLRGGIWPVSIAGQNPNIDRAFHQASLRYVTPGFFDTLDIPLLQGRVIRASDTARAQNVAVVSRSFAKQYWPGRNPIGRHFQFVFADRTVVGIVGDVRVRGLEQESEPQVYLSYQQVPDDSIVWYTPKDLAIRSDLPPEQLVPAVRRIIAGADPQLPVSDVRPMSKIVFADLGPRLIQICVLAGFATIAVALAAIGIYGLLSFTVASRSQEIGVRMAVGATAGHILALILRESLLLALAGMLAGTAFSYASGQALNALLAGISPADPATYEAALCVALAMTLIGSFLPALRALRVDPMRSIRAG